MNIVIDIASLDNRGDWLMFEAVYEQVLKRFPFAHVAVPERAFVRNTDYFRQKNVMRQIDKITLKHYFRLLLSALRHRDISYLHFMTSCSVDLLLFTPGFRFSDQFNITDDNVIDKEISHFRSFSKKGRKVIFLPQAFGPFETQTERRHVTECCRLANHIYAREKTSYNHLMKVMGESDRVSIALDFTCLYHGEKYPL